MWIVVHDNCEWQEIHECENKGEALDAVRDIFQEYPSQGNVYLAKVVQKWQYGEMA